jgi:hypothetical protein
MVGEPGARVRCRGVFVLAAIVAACLMAGPVCAQIPAGAISGEVTDPDKKGVGGARILITSKETGQTRSVRSGEAGEYRAEALLPGRYEICVEAAGFQRVVSEVLVQVGRTTTVDVALVVGPIEETVRVSGAQPEIRYDAHEVAGVVTREQIEDLPLNGRSYLELARLEPGAQTTSRGTDNLTFVPVLGAPIGVNGRGTRITVDGGSVMHVGRGGTPLNISQEAVQEFQVSSANFDPATGATASGAVNVVTRSGSNTWHGASFLFYRDHRLSAYPGLGRETADRAPSFQRGQYGVAAGGPIRKDKAFLFATYERTQQRGLISTPLASPDFSALTRTTASPSYANLASLRTDFAAGRNHTVFLRHSHEDGVSYGTATSNQAVVLRGYPSAWWRARTWADQSLLGVTSQVGPRVVNELRFSYFFISTMSTAPTEADCAGCLGLGAPSITIRPELFLGVSTTWTVLARRYHVHDVVSWQKGSHHVRFGGDWEITRGGRTDLQDEPVTMTLFHPDTVRLYNALPTTPPELRIPLPATFLTLEDILKLPVQSFTVGIGDPKVRQANGGVSRIAPLVRVFAHDSWRARPRLTLNYGLGWSYEAQGNYDLSKPAYLEPILGAGGLGPTSRNLRDFSPSAGFAWSLRENGKTVLRGGAGVYYNASPLYSHADRERTSLGPRGTGRGAYGSAGIANPLASIPGVPQGAPLFFPLPTLFTGARLMEALPGVRSALSRLRGDSNHPDDSVTNIEVGKQGFLLAGEQPTSAARHASLGVQREFMRDFVVTADFVYRGFTGLAAQPDRNRFFSASGPVLPVCTATQQSDPQARCAAGPIEAFMPIGRAKYRGLLVRAEKRFSQGWQMLGSYAYASNTGHVFDIGFNNNDWLQNYGPLDRDVRHILNLSGTLELPGRIQLGAIVTYYSAPPFTAFLGGIDLNGDGTTGDLLPGTGVNEFNRGLGKGDLVRLVEDFNATRAGGRDGRGRIIPSIQLPERFEFGDSLLTHDVRLSRSLALRERWRLVLIGEVFNLFNIANLSGHSGDLLHASFGQATSRVTQVFGPGGPRSFQFAARLSF